MECECVKKNNCVVCRFFKNCKNFVVTKFKKLFKKNKTEEAKPLCEKEWKEMTTDLGGEG